MTADPDLPYLYSLPGDCLRLREVGQRRTIWRVDGIFLRADEPGPLRLRYTRKIVNEMHLPAGFRLALAADLAARLSPRWLGTAAKVDALTRLADQRLREAMRTDRAMGSQQTWRGDAPADWASEIAR